MELGLEEHYTRKRMARGRGRLNFMERISEEEAPEVNKDYSNIIDAIKKINTVDDGIRFQVKLAFAVRVWTRDCENAMEVKQSIDFIYNASLLDSELIPKLIMLVSSRTFNLQAVHQKNIGQLFYRKLIRESCQGFGLMLSRHPQRFRNTVKLIGEFFHKARLRNGKVVISMALPLIDVMEMLLTSNNPTDSQIFTNQIYLNGRALEQVHFKNVQNMMNKVRLIICGFDMNYSKESRLFLLLAVELYDRKFDLIPGPIYEFYVKELGENVMGFYKV